MTAAEKRREAGRKGGRATFDRHGSVHMAAIGAVGYWTTCQLHHYGDMSLYGKYLSDRSPATAKGPRVPWHLETLEPLEALPEAA